MKRDGDSGGEFIKKRFQQYWLSLAPAQREVLQKNITAACHDGRHGTADRRSGRTKRRHRFGKKHK